MNILDGIRNFLMFVNNHWTEIIVIAGILLAVGKKSCRLSEYVR